MSCISQEEQRNGSLICNMTVTLAPGRKAWRNRVFHYVSLIAGKGQSQACQVQAWSALSYESELRPPVS